MAFLARQVPGVSFVLKSAPARLLPLMRLSAANAAAITLGKTIYVRQDIGLSPADVLALVAHEMVHIRQAGQLGLVRFLAQYVVEWVVRGYWNISFEREAVSLQMACIRELENQEYV